jgi:hypothetical protein
MAMKMMLKHKMKIPKPKAERGLLLPKTSMSAPGIIPTNAKKDPKQRPINPGNPHKSTVATVAMRPEVLLSILISPDYKILVSYFKTYSNEMEG